MKNRIKNGIRGSRLAPPVGAVAAAAALMLAGCGSSGGSEATGSAVAAAGAGSAGGPPGLQLSEEARTCLAEQGVELPQGPPGQAAGGEAPEGAERPSGAPSGGVASSTQMAKMAEALEACGVEAPAPSQN